MKKKKTFTSKLALFFVFVLAVIYTVYHVANLFSTDELSTIVSGVTNVKDTVGGRGYMFRDEQILRSENTGAVDYFVANGDKVANSQALADIYEGNGSLSRPAMQTLDWQIELLEKSMLGSSLYDYEALENEANAAYYDLVNSINSSDVGNLESQIQNMTVSLNKINEKKNSTQSNSEGISDVLKSLYTVRANILSGSSVTEYSNEGGYFYYYPDGFEEYFNIDAAKNLTEDGFYRLEEYLLKNASQDLTDANVYGKLAKNNSWYFVLALPLDEVGSIEAGREYILTFPENNNAEIGMTLEKTIESKENNELICILYCNKLPSGFRLDRSQNAQIDIMSVSGIYVPRTAIHKLDGINGVYVLRGSVVRFRCVEIIYSGYDYYIVSGVSDKENKYDPLDTNELIITNGKNLFDGRILE